MNKDIKAKVLNILDKTKHNEWLVKNYTFVEHDGKYIDVCQSKPPIEKVIAYNDEYDAPKVTKDYFIDYNMKYIKRNLLN